ncbi:MAG: 2OG-Fe(II) oxygenase, partial [Proteobacteria bacterium]|nr:2OG-Fe(II) oxygenase [Pseudomonadota bacterium]
RVARLDWDRIAGDLDARGHASAGALLTGPECDRLRGAYGREGLFRSRVVMARHNFGLGEYRYFGYPLPEPVASLREALYPPLAAIAGDWAERLATGERYPVRLEEYLARCHAAGQVRPTPLLLRYEAEGYNCLHQDLYGELAFPLQVAIALSQPERDFTGGAFLLVEQRPRAQSRGEALTLAKGEAVIFANRDRPVAGKRGHYRVKMRHGVSRVTSGTRMTLGLIFHDAL